MKLLNFLKQLSKGKDDVPVEQVQLSEMEGWLFASSSDARSSTFKELENIRLKIAQGKQKLSDGIQALNAATLKNVAIPERVKHIREDNRRSYVQRLELLIEQIDLPDSFEEIAKFNEWFNRALSEFSTGSARNYYILKEFFENEANAIAASLNNISQEVAKANEISVKSEISKIDDLSNKIRETKKTVDRKTELETKIKKSSTMIEQIGNEVSECKKNVEDLIKGKEYKNLKKDENGKKEILFEISELNRGVVHSFSIINTALKKYERMTLDTATVKKYVDMNDPRILADDKIAVELLKMKELIIKGDIELKDKKKERTLHELELLNAEYFDTFLKKQQSASNRLEMANKKIQDSPIRLKYEELLEKVKNSEQRMAFQKENLENQKTEYDTINIEELKADLQKKVRDYIGKDVRIL